MSYESIIAVSVMVIVALSSFAVLLSVLFSFIFYHRSKEKTTTRSPVATTTMILFFLLYYVTIRFGFTRVSIEPLVHIILMIVCAIVIIFGAYVNIVGRVDLKSNWADQIKIYPKHTLIRSGMYTYVRHPLYASLLWMFIAASLIYTNIFALILALCVFWPMMAFRAKQEELQLQKRFKEYSSYKKRTGMFFPKVFK